jgi:16S rRNA (guanine527-N7)-methyltransferase
VVPSITDELRDARRLGLLGPGPLATHRAHSIGYARVLQRASFPQSGSRLLDLGSGGGVPGLVLAYLWPSISVTLLDSSERRCSFLESWTLKLGWSDRVTVECGRAEELGRGELRGSFNAVVARSFGRPAVAAECGSPFLGVGGLLVVSDPPGLPGSENVGSPDDRWPRAPLGLLGLEHLGEIASPFHFTILCQRMPCPHQYPRRTGVPGKRPLF